MGAKFYRGADKPKKLKKRFTQTRTWFRTLKWVACKCVLAHPLRPRASYPCGWPPLQGILGLLDWIPPASRHEALPDRDARALRPSQPLQGCRCCCCYFNGPLILELLQLVLRVGQLRLRKHCLRQDDERNEELLRKQREQSRCRLPILYRWLQPYDLRYKDDLTALHSI